MLSFFKQSIIVNKKYVKQKKRFLKYLEKNKIETRPSRTLANSHDFFIDSEGHMNDPKLKSVIKEIQSKGASLRILGSYPEDS